MKGKMKIPLFLLFCIILLLLILCILYFNDSFITNFNQVFIKINSTSQQAAGTVKKVLTNIKNTIDNSNLTESSINLNTQIRNLIIINSSTIPPETYGYFYPKGQDNTKPFDDTNLLKELPRHGCTSETNLLVAVRTSPNEFIEREWIRNNWGKYRSSNTPLIFVVGSTKKEEIKKQIDEEQKKYGDLLLLNFDDHYRNLSIKNYGLFQYFDAHCPNANCLLKPDSDTVTNIIGIEQLCNYSSVDKKLITSYVINKPGVIRDPTNKWYVPQYVYPNPNYDVYSAGWGFLITGKNSVKDLIEALKNKSPFLTSENYRRLPDDAIQTGDVRILANISIEHNNGFGIFAAIILWTDPRTNEFVPLMTEAGNYKKDIWDQYKKIIETNNSKKIINKFVKAWISGNDTQVILKESMPCLAFVCQILSLISKEEAAKFSDLKKLCS